MLESKGVSKKPFLAIAGILATVVFGVVGVYLFLHEKKPDIFFEIISEANVLDLHRPLKDLAISFQGKDIQQENLNLRVLTIRIENRGELDVLQSHFDQNITWGFRITEGEIINEVRLVNSNSGYLESNLKPKVIDKNTVQLQKVIFEREKYFILELLILHEQGKLVEIIPTGKIAGIDKIGVKPCLGKESLTFFEKFIYGGVLINLFRLLAFFIGLAVFISVAVLIGFINDRIRRMMLGRVLQIGQESIKSEVLMDLLISGRPRPRQLEELRELDALLANEDGKLSEILAEYLVFNVSKKFLISVSAFWYASSIDKIEFLIRSDILILKDNNEYSVDPEFGQMLKKSIDYLQTKLGK